jgi:hypothetical protein
MKRQVQMAEVIAAGVAARMAATHTMLIGRVEAVNRTARKVDVRIATLRVLQDDTGALRTEELPVVRQVPIGALRAGGARIDMPIDVGQWVCVLCFEDNIGKWLATGGVSVNPGDVERHGLTGAVAIPLLYPDPETRVLPPLHATDVVVAIEDGPELRVTPAAVVVVGDLQVTGDVLAGTASAPTTRSLLGHTHNTAMGPSGPPNPEP